MEVCKVYINQIFGMSGAVVFLIFIYGSYRVVLKELDNNKVSALLLMLSVFALGIYSQLSSG